MAAGWGADFGDLTPGPVFPDTSSCGDWDSLCGGWDSLCGDWDSLCGHWDPLCGDWESRERGWGEKIVPLCPEMRMLSECSCALQALPKPSFLSLNSLGSVVTLISEQTLGAIINDQIISGQNDCASSRAPQFQKASGCVKLPVLTVPLAKSLLEKLNESPSTKKDVHLSPNMW